MRLLQFDLPFSFLVLMPLVCWSRAPRPASTQSNCERVQLHSHQGHNMSCLGRLSSSSETVMFPMYQNIHKNRLRKSSKGPDNTKKSQKLNGAKIPTKKRTTPTMSIITASDRRTVENLLSSMSGPGETDRWMECEALTRTSARLSRKVLPCLVAHPQHTLHFYHSSTLARLVFKHHNGFCCSLAAQSSTVRLHSFAGLTCFVSYESTHVYFIISHH